MDSLWRDYSPSCWSKRFANRDLLIEHHLAFIRLESERAVDNLSCQVDVKYGEGERQKLDIFGTDLPEHSPIVAFVHGGYWHELSREESRYFAARFHQRGIKTLIVGYDLCPEVTVQTIVRQIREALAYIFKYAQRKTESVYLMGHSAGAHLVAKCLSDKSFLDSVPNLDSLKAAFLVAGIYDLTDLIKTPENIHLRLSPEEARALSPQFDNFFHLKERNLHLYVISAEHDSRIFISQSRNLYDKLMESCQVQCVHFKILQHMDHFQVVEVLSEPDNYILDIISQTPS